MKHFIESIRRRFGDNAAHVATIYLLCREIMMEAGNPILAELTSGIISGVSRKAEISAALLNLIVKESENIEQIDHTVH